MIQRIPAAAAKSSVFAHSGLTGLAGAFARHGLAVACIALAHVGVSTAQPVLEKESFLSKSKAPVASMSSPGTSIATSAIPAPLKRDSATVYRQVLPGGRIIYTDNPIQGQKIDKVIHVDLRAAGVWSASNNVGTVNGIVGSTAPTPGVASDAPDQRRPRNFTPPAPLDPAAARAQSAADALTQLQAKFAQDAYERTKPGTTRPVDPSDVVVNGVRVDLAAQFTEAEERFNQANAALRDVEVPLPGERIQNANGTSRLSPEYFERQTRAKEDAQKAAIEYDNRLTQLRDGK